MAKCFFCGHRCRSDDDFCYGCLKLVCRRCDRNELLEGEHLPHDHLVQVYDDPEYGIIEVGEEI